MKFRFLLSIMTVLTLTLSPFVDASSPYERVIEAYELRGGDAYMIDEEIIQRSHVLQAAYLASVTGAPEEVIIGLLLHDIGQIIHEEKVGNIAELHEKHDDFGADWLQEAGFPERVVKIVRYHTLAKLFLCEERENYFENLSQASKDSYVIQKKKYMESDEKSATVAAFTEDPYREQFKAARMIDEMAKLGRFDALSDDSRVDRETFFHPPGFEEYSAMVERVLQGKGRGANDERWTASAERLYGAMIENVDEFERVVRLGPEMILDRYCNEGIVTSVD
jgi:putative nucleotidyltransferase with HDIG domain